ncbi:MAG: helicase-exonuclease AddAB subunit AddA [Clostridia bacterium]|nr:helicase-exonuclease AddAB subunit AddA [Clostridia bacterium]
MKAAAEARWTPAQLEAAERRGGALLVAAAAGTGKTAVLIERIRRWVLAPPGVDLDRLLVVTFTEAAASEVRERLADSLRRALEKDPENLHLKRQLVRLGQAWICTLHSFCLQLLRRYFYHAGLDPEFRVAGEEECKLLQAEIASSVLEEGYAENPRAVIRLLEHYGSGRGPEALLELVLHLYRFSLSHPHPQEWLDEVAASFLQAPAAEPEQLVWTQEVKDALALELVTAAEWLAAAGEIASGAEPLGVWAPVLAGEYRTMEDLARAAGDGPWEEWRRRLGSFAFGRLPAARREDPSRPFPERERARELRDRAKERVRALREYYGELSAERIRADLARVAPLMQGLVRLTQRFAEAYRRAKELRRILDFADLEHYTVRLLEDPELPVAGELRARLVEVLVDECQDLNPVQEAILRLLAPENLFMVGDARQSIYRFRLAEPRLFSERLRRLKPQGRLINLNVNFRSRRPVLEAVNFLFRQLGESGEQDPDDLVYGASYTPADPAAAAEGPVEVYLLEPAHNEGEEPQEESGPEREARLIAGRLRRMVEGTPEKPGPEFMVWEGDRYVPVGYGHIAVLLRATRERANAYAEVLQRMGLPARAELSAGYFEAPEVRLLTALLEIADNPYQDIPLAAVLRSPVVGLTDEELAEVRLCRRGTSLYEALLAASASAPHLKPFLSRLDRWRTLVRQRPLPDAIWQLLEESSLYRLAGELAEGRQRQANLRALIGLARKFESTDGRGLGAFLDYLERLRESDADLGPAAPGAGQGQAVRIMSIHKAKGLEFPVVVLADLGRPFNLGETKGDLLLHRDLGLGPMLVDPERGYKYPTWAWLAIRERNRREVLEEEKRILYVALTRARERLILVGTQRDLAARAREWSRAAWRQGWSLGPAWLRQANCYLDWLGPALARHADGWPLRRLGGGPGPKDGAVANHPSRWQVFLLPEVCLPAGVAETRVRGTARAGGAGQAAAETSQGAFDRQLAQTAAKVTVSELMAALETEGDLPGRPLWRSSLRTKPAFLGAQAETEAERVGRITHLVLEHLDLSGDLDRQDLEKQLAGLTEKGLLTPEEAERVDTASLVWFWSSSLGRELRARARRLAREVSFGAGLPARLVHPELPPETAAEEKVLVQGKIDLLAEVEDGFLLVDFKTGREPEERERLATYVRQLFYYARAVEAVFGRKVREAYLVFLGEGKIVPVGVGETGEA